MNAWIVELRAADAAAEKAALAYGEAVRLAADAGAGGSGWRFSDERVSKSELLAMDEAMRVAANERRRLALASLPALLDAAEERDLLLDRLAAETERADKAEARVNIEHAGLQECMEHEVARIAERDAARAERDALRARIEALHQHDGDVEHWRDCLACDEPWPCPTIAAALSPAEETP